MEGIVFADSPELATAIADSMGRLAPRVRARLGNPRPIRPEVWVQTVLRETPFWRAPEYFNGMASLDGSKILVQVGAAGRPPSDLTLAHELTHVYLAASPNESLPWAMEEAVCASVAQSLAPGVDAQAERGWLLLMALAAVRGDVPRLNCIYDAPGGAAAPVSLGSIQFDVMGNDPRTFDRLTSHDLLERDQPDDELAQRAARGLAYFVVERFSSSVGLESLLTEASAITEGSASDWIAKMCASTGLSEDTTSWEPAIVADLDAVVLRALLVESQVGLAEVGTGPQSRIPRGTMRMLIGEFPGSDGTRFVQEGRPRLVLAGSSIEVPLADVPALRDQVEAAWREAVDEEAPIGTDAPRR